MGIEPVLGMCFLKKRNEIWIYSSKSIQQLIIINEEKDVWKFYLEKSMFKEALEICRNMSLPQTNYVELIYKFKKNKTFNYKKGSFFICR